MSNFSCNLTRNITPHSMKNLAVHSILSWQMIILPILTTWLIHFSFDSRRQLFMSNIQWVTMKIHALEEQTNSVQCSLFVPVYSQFTLHEVFDPPGWQWSDAEHYRKPLTFGSILSKHDSDLRPAEPSSRAEFLTLLDNSQQRTDRRLWVVEY